ncbi:MAG: DegT/DnrJ/EryC1/StrS family aminotransferase, partial [Bacteroidetes bacterium]|nr:DegT/DnrJ/EryC1/StrS family aminotransferase [Bacteroidota bacterium]
SNICAGIGRGQMEVLDEHVLLRREMNQFYKDIFKNKEGISVFSEPSDKYFSNHWLSCVVVDESLAGFPSEAIRLALQKDNIEARPLWKPMHLQPIFSKAPYYGNQISENLFNNGVCLPSGSNLTASEKQRIKKVLTNFV